MKLIILILLFLNLSLFANDYPIMLKLKGNIKLSNDFRDGIEEGLTAYNYTLIDENAQKEALASNSEDNNDGCLDDSCLIDTGKMLAAKAIIIVEVEKRGDSYKFKTRFVDFEKGVTTKTKVLYYSSGLKSYKKLYDFGKEVVAKLLNINISKRILKPWKLNFSTFGGLFNGDIYIDHKTVDNGNNSENHNFQIYIESPGIGFSLGTTYKYSSFMDLFINLNFFQQLDDSNKIELEVEKDDTGATHDNIKTNYNKLTNIKVDFGARFEFTDIFYTKLGLSLGMTIAPKFEYTFDNDSVVLDLETQYVQSITFVVESGVNFDISQNNFDIYLSFTGGKYVDSTNSNLRDNSSLVQVLLGLRYNFYNF